MRRDLKDDFNQDLWNGDLETTLNFHDKLENKRAIKKLLSNDNKS